MFRNGMVKFEEMLRANLSALDAELEFAETQEQRLKLLSAAVTQARELEETVTELYRAGQATRVDALKAKAGRLEREIALERAQQEFNK